MRFVEEKSCCQLLARASALAVVRSLFSPINLISNAMRVTVILAFRKANLYLPPIICHGKGRQFNSLRLVSRSSVDDGVSRYRMGRAIARRPQTLRIPRPRCRASRPELANGVAETRELPPGLRQF